MRQAKKAAINQASKYAMSILSMYKHSFKSFYINVSPVRWEHRIAS